MDEKNSVSSRSVKKVRRKSKSDDYDRRQRWMYALLTVVLIGGLCAWWGLNGLFEREDTPDDQGQSDAPPVISSSVGYSISTSSEYATKAGAAILEQGGNAVDAAIAISYALGVSEPYASGLGGGGCMVVYDPRMERFTFYNYGSEAPQSGNSWLTLVPGLVSGMEAVRKDFGTMDYAQLLQPALDCCDGVVINAISAMRIRNAAGALPTSSPFYGPNGYLVEGDVLVQSELKETLQCIVDEGPDAFYTGSIAQKIADGTYLKMSDLAAYRTIRTDAVVGTYRDYTVGTAAAPFSGATLLQMLKMAEALEISDPDENRTDFLADLLKISQISQYERLQNVCDLRFENIGMTQQEMVSNGYIAQILNLDVSDFTEEEECEDTTGFTVIDQDGMVVACTNTLSSFFGSRGYVGGFFMNNTGYLFGSGVNDWEKGKRPRTHISPAILVSDDEVIAVASPGGNLITKVIANVLLDICQFGEEAQTAIDKQRTVFLYGNVLYYEVGYKTPLLVEVAGCGYPSVAYSSHPYFGNVALSGYREESGFYATRDIRRGGYGMAANG